MYCFHCGKSLIEIDGVLTCTAGQMPLSRNLHRELGDLFPSQRFHTTTRPPIKSTWGAGTFCPGCGVELEKSICPSCSTDLRRFQHAFIELHPHWYPGTKNWG